MPVNPFFNFTTFATEQNLLEDLIIETIQIYGHSAYYVPREDADIDRLFGEDTLAHYDDAHEIEIYLKSNRAFAGPTELTKFGLSIEDQATFCVAVRRFAQVLGGRLPRPRENDIIYIQFTPTNRMLFEIRFVQQLEQLFQLGKLYTYELDCEVMNYSHERVQTTLPELNQVAERNAFTVDIPMGTGSGDYILTETVYQGSSFIDATATGTVVNWDANTHILSVQSITGEFNTDTVVGIISNVQYSPVVVPDTSPKARDPESDNDLLTSEEPTIVLPRTNPRYT